MYLARKYKFGTLFLRLLRDTELPFYVVVRARRRSSRLHGVDSIFISQIFKTMSIGPVPAGNRALQSSALPTEQILEY